MKKNLFEITEQEKKEIFEKHNSLKEFPKYNVDINFITEAKPITQTSGLPAWTNDYPCLSDIGTITKTTSDEQVVYLSDKDKQYFFKDKTYKYIYESGSSVFGTWECKNGTLFIKTKDGEQWEKGKGWVKQPKTNNGGGTTQQPKKSKYTKCSEELPIKQYCKNETIRKVQACLKMPKRYQTGNFGPITQEYLESRDQNGTSITTETIINICGANHPLVTSGGTTGGGTTGGGTPYSAGLNAGTPNVGGQTVQSKTGYEDYTVDEIEYSKDSTKPSTPSEKPEGETSTGYEGYSEEPANKPAKSANTPSTGVVNKKSFYNPLNPDDTEV